MRRIETIELHVFPLSSNIRHAHRAGANNVADCYAAVYYQPRTGRYTRPQSKIILMSLAKWRRYWQRFKWLGHASPNLTTTHGDYSPILQLRRA